MATSLNTFKSFHATLTTTEQVVYATPANYTSVVLLAQAANTSTSGADVTFMSRDGDTSVDTELVDSFLIAPNDAVGLLTGKFVLEEGNSLVALSGTNSVIKLTISVLETLNES